MRRLLPAVVLLAMVVVAADAASPKKVCRKGCTKATATCVGTVRSGLKTAKGTCAGSADAKSCRRDASRLAKDGKRICRAFRKRCRACCASGGVACDRAPEVPIASGEFPVPDRHVLDAVPLPTQADGGYVLLSLPDGDFGFDPKNRGPASAAAECASAVLACFDPTLRNWAGCFASVPRCESDRPWEGDGPMCCAAACADRYQERLAEGLDPPTAFAFAIWMAPSCMPGLEGHVPGAGIP